MAVEKEQILEMIDQQRRAGQTRLIGLSLSGANLAGLELSDCSLPSVDLSGADLSGARLTRVNLTRASLRGARLENASLSMVSAAGAVLTEVHAPAAQFEHVKFSQADLSRGDLNKTLFDSCTLEAAILDEAQLRNAQLVYSNCRDASFRGALLDQIATIGSVFPGANFKEARVFYRSPEIVTEVLRREAGEDFELIKAIGAICIDRNRCYEEWRRYLKNHPDQHDFAVRVFSAYPASGCLHAVRGEFVVS